MIHYDLHVPVINVIDHQILLEKLPLIIGNDCCFYYGIKSVFCASAVTRSAREKEKLANIMAYGEDVEKIPISRVQKRLETPPPEPDRFEECKLV
jgi:hypothetical protein